MSDFLLRRAEQQSRSAICLAQKALDSTEFNSGFKRHALVNAILLQAASALRLLVGQAVDELSKSKQPVSNYVISTKQWQDFGALGLRSYLRSYTTVPDNTLMASIHKRLLLAGDSVNNLLYLLESLDKDLVNWYSADLVPDNLIASNAIKEDKPEHWTRVGLEELMQILEDTHSFIQEMRVHEEEF